MNELSPVRGVTVMGLPSPAANVPVATSVPGAALHATVGDEGLKLNVKGLNIVIVSCPLVVTVAPSAKPQIPIPRPNIALRIFNMVDPDGSIPSKQRRRYHAIRRRLARLHDTYE
jgi:hypothetical protein